MEECFKINVFFDENRDELEKIISEFLIKLINSK